MICVMDRALQRLRSFVRGQPNTSPIRFDPKSGGMGIRTPDIQLAKLALYQLSYTPRGAGSSAEVASTRDGENLREGNG